MNKKVKCKKVEESALKLLKIISAVLEGSK